MVVAYLIAFLLCWVVAGYFLTLWVLPYVTKFLEKTDGSHNL
jgi:hypothetical protein